MHAIQWPKPVSVQFKLINCKNSTKDAPKLAFLSSNIEKIFREGTQPSPDTHAPVGRGTPPPHGGRRLDPRAYGARPRPQGRLPRVLWAPSDALVTEIDP